MLANLFRRRLEGDAVTDLYRRLVEKARDPAFYIGVGVPDTVDGRFDMIILHAMLVLRRLRGQGTAAETLGQELFDLMFRDMDRSLRELGVGDMGVGKHIKRMAQAFYGRAEQYERGMDAIGESAVLDTALTANLFRHGSPAPAQLAVMRSYLKRADGHIAAQALAEILQGRIDFEIPVEQAHGPAA